MFDARKLIRDKKTKEWLTQNGFAVLTDVGFALDVQTFAQARRVCREHRGRSLELVVYFPDRAEVVIPLDDEE